VINFLKNKTNIPFKIMKNKFYGMATHDEIVQASGGLKALAGSLFKMANDIRWLGSGPYGGLGELILPANEPGSSMMPGKVNPTQCEALMMVCMQVFGHDFAISFAGSQGNFELNTAKPLIIALMLKSMELLSDAMKSFEKYLLQDLQANKKNIARHLSRSLMEITEMAPKIGYDQAAKVVQYASANQLDLKTALNAITH
jgi:fumarate hydratase, class II